MANENELLPCPFCDGEATFSKGEFRGKQADYIECLQCGANSDMKFSKDKVAKLWNTRPLIEQINDAYTQGFTIAMKMMKRWCSRPEQTMDGIKYEIEFALLFNNTLTKRYDK